MANLTWDDLDKCETADEIAELLRQHGIRGRRNDYASCPLARATGWAVGTCLAMLGEEERWLTDAEEAFVQCVDAGSYPDLVERPELPPLLRGAESVVTWTW